MLGFQITMLQLQAQDYPPTVKAMALFGEYIRRQDGTLVYTSFYVLHTKKTHLLYAINSNIGQHW